MNRPDEYLHLPLGPVLGGREQLLVVLRREVAREDADGGEVQPAVVEPLEQDGKPSRGSSYLDAQVRLVLGQMEHFQAVAEER